ncbi:LacI family DNA-binding transcriptional regulator [Modestobacter sp. I12A-02662]|uniref:LacI family DNA-binding transcriptional regulator n=1 Tax=Modestobacter sp. I12A-02662 TaxID=1730496 RepID=UPI0034DF9F36
MAGRSIGVRDVAALANVSLGTVSNVMNNPDRVGAEVRARVEAAMADLGFVPSRAAGQLRSRRSELVGVVVPDVGNPYWASVLRGIESVIEEHGLALVVGSTHQETRRQHRLLRGLESQGVDGLILAPITADSEDWAPFVSRRFGVVALERKGVGTSVSSVSLDNVEGGRLAVTHLLERGHREVAFINGPRTVPWCGERREGVVAGLREHGLDPQAALVEVEVSDLTVAEGLSAVEALLAAGDRPTAIMCANDMLALGAVLALRARGIDVPGDMALVGYDDVEFAAALAPPLTTVRQPSFEMGVAAARLLLRADADGAGEHLQFVPELVARRSSDSPPRPAPRMTAGR